jgi:hypothetical protein
MGQIAKLTSGDLPVAELIEDNAGVFLPDFPTSEGSWQSRKIWDMWSDAELNNAGYARFSEVLPGADEVSTGASDVFTAGVVTRTHTTDLKPVDELRSQLRQATLDHRRIVAGGGLTYSGYPFATNTSATNDINLIFNALNAGETFPGNTIPWDTMDGQVLNANEAQFLAFAKAVAAHRIKCTKAAAAHIDAIIGLATAQEVVDYDITSDILGSEWPVNPVV